MSKESTASAHAPTTSEAESGTLCWVNLMARDLADARSFYGGVLGWEFRRSPVGGEFSVAVVDGRPVAGIGALASTLQVAVAWTPYFAVPDIDATAARIRERTGTVAVGPLSLASGRALLAADRDGATFGVWEGELFEGFDCWQRDAPAWVRLRSRDAFATAIFYGEVLDWGSAPGGRSQVRYEDDEVVLRTGGHAVARLSSGAHLGASDPTERPRWLVYFPVADVEHCVREAQLLGGEVVSLETAPLGAEATLRDPDGGLFTVTQATRAAALGGHD